MITKEDYIRRLIKKQLLKESVPGSVTGQTTLEIRIDKTFDIKKLEVYKTGQYKNILEEFYKVIEEKKLQEFRNNIIQCIVGDFFKDSDDFVESFFIANLKALDNTTSPWKAQNAGDLVEKLNSVNKSNDTIKKLYNLIKPTFYRSGGWGAGKGEILSLLLADPKYKSGGTGDKDLYNNDSDFIELKQIDIKGFKINININSFSGKQIALDFQENLADIKNSINLFKEILEDDFIKTDVLKQNNWEREFFDKNGKVKSINNPKKGNELLEKFDDSRKDETYSTDLYELISKFIFEDYNNGKYVKAALFGFESDKTVDPKVNLKNISRIKEGNIFPIYKENNNALVIQSYTNDIYQSIKNTYDILKDQTGNTIDQKFKGMYTQSKNPTLKSNYQDTFNEIIKFLGEYQNSIKTDWFEHFISSFNDYFDEKINIINNPTLLKISLNQFVKSDFDTLFDDILIRSLDEIEKKLNNISSIQKDDNDVLITLDDGESEIELITTINDFKIVEPTDFDLNGSLKNINNDITKIQFDQVKFADDSMKKKINNKRYKTFFAINENNIRKRLIESGLQSSVRLIDNSNLIDVGKYTLIDSYEKNAKIKNRPLLYKVNNLIANLICLEKSISDYFQSGLVIIQEENENIKRSEVLLGQSKTGQIDIINERIKTGKGSIDLFDNNKLKVETRSLFKSDFECLLFRLLSTRKTIKDKIEKINNLISAKKQKMTNSIP